ncbi:hypothetical protein [Azospirillum doebereinerae]
MPPQSRASRSAQALGWAISHALFIEAIPVSVPHAGLAGIGGIAGSPNGR